MSQDTSDLKEINKGNSLSQKEKEERKQQVLTQGRASITRSIADALAFWYAGIHGEWLAVCHGCPDRVSRTAVCGIHSLAMAVSRC